jgi:ABC-2 type transport system ATP-binding protein
VLPGGFGQAFLEAALPMFERRVALDGLDRDVATRAVLGLLGPGGAPNTTLVLIMATLVSPTAGRAPVHGSDVHDQPV